MADDSDSGALRRRCTEGLVAAGAVAVGLCGTEPLEEARHEIERRRDAGLHGGMAFTFRNPARSCDPRSALPSARTAIVAALPYRSERADAPPEPGAAVARYAADDTYATLRRALQEVVATLHDAGRRAVAVADSNALVDRAIAHRAGLGWFGHNTNLLVPGVGSWVVLGSVLTDADLLEGDERLTGGAPPVEPGCGTCRRCLVACPTGALVAPGVMDAGRCLSWLLQVEGDFPREHRVALGTRLYGCDDCQEVCPINVDAPQLEVPVAMGRPGAGPGDWVELRRLLTATDEELLGELGAFYIPRREVRYLRRNALVALGNHRGVSAVDAAELLRVRLLGGDPMLAAHAAWAARRHGLVDLLAEPEVAAVPAVAAELAAIETVAAELAHPAPGGET